MLVHLSVHNYAIVEHLDLELKRGMSVISGETGAGKSIMLDALGLTLGDRADSSVVRIGADKADILASFDLDDIPDARAWLAERDMDSEGPCILRRVITAEGRSRGYINGTPCPQGDLKALGELLLDIHSQHEHQSLLKADTHRRLLDEYSGSQELARQVQLAAQRWRQTRQTLERLSNSSDEQRARHQLLSYQLEELENLALGENELEQLEQEHKNLANAEQLLGACRQVMELCSESDAGNVLSALTSSLQRLTAFQNQPQALSEAVNLLASAQIQVEEAIGELNRFADHFDAAEHPCDLLDASGLVQLGHGRAGFIAAAGLVHEQVVVSLRSHLRQVRDGQDLAALAEAAQQLADDFRGRAADANIDFVEPQRRHARRLCGDHLDRQADP